MKRKKERQKSKDPWAEVSLHIILTNKQHVLKSSYMSGAELLIDKLPSEDNNGRDAIKPNDVPYIIGVDGILSDRRVIGRLVHWENIEYGEGERAEVITNYLQAKHEYYSKYKTSWHLWAEHEASLTMPNFHLRAVFFVMEST